MLCTCASPTAGATDGCVKLWDMRQTTEPRDVATYGRGPGRMQHPVLGSREPRVQADTRALNGNARRCGITCLQQPPGGGRMPVRMACCLADQQGLTVDAPAWCTGWHRLGSLLRGWSRRLI
jgi:hypothetical protein